MRWRRNPLYASIAATFSVAASVASAATVGSVPSVRQPSSAWRTEGAIVQQPAGAPVPSRAVAGYEDVLLEVLVPGFPPKTVLLYEGPDSRLYVPAAQADALGVPFAETEVLAGLNRAVLAGISLVRISEDQVQLSAPANYFGHTSLRFGVETDVVPLVSLPAYWLNYDMFVQPVAGYRPYGGALRGNVTMGNFAVKSEFRANQSYMMPALSRVSSSLTGRIHNAHVEFGDLAHSSALPVTTSRNMLGIRVASNGVQGPVGTAQLHGATDTPGRVTVNANGAPIASYNIMPGTFEVSDLPRIGGAGLYELVFDDGKNVKLLGAINTLNPIALLSPGQYAYSVAGGVAQSSNSAMLGSPQYTNTMVVDASMTYGTGLHHNVSGTIVSSANETWVGGGVLTEWSAVSSKFAAYSVHSPKASGVVVQGSSQWQGQSFSFGLGVSQFFGSPQGTPTDGFLSERKVNAGWKSLSAYWLSSQSYSGIGRTQFVTKGIGYSTNFGALSLSANAARTQRNGVDGAWSFGLFASWSFAAGKAAYGSVTENRTAIGGRARGDDWQLNLERQQAASAGIASQLVAGQVGARYGVVYGSATHTSAPGGSRTMLGFSGAAAAVQTSKGLLSSGYSPSQGDSLIVADTGSPGAELMLNHTRRVVANPDGIALVPAFSSFPQTLQLDVRTLSFDMTAGQTKRRVQIPPGAAGFTDFDTRPLGLGVSLVMPEGTPVDEGSVVRTVGGYETLVGSEGQVWLEAPAPELTVQTEAKKFCIVKNLSKAGRYVCQPN